MELVTEYLVIIDKVKSDATYALCDSVETFDKMISTQENVDIAAGEITHDNLKLGYGVQQGDIEGKEQRYFHVKITFDDDEARLDEFSAALRAIRTGFFQKTTDVRTLRDDVAFYYANKSYPLIFTVENLMRRLIYQFMLTNVGNSWADETSAPIKQVLDANVNRRPTEDILHRVDFIDLKDYLFKAYPSKTESKIHDLIRDVENAAELDLAVLRSFRPKSNWERYFSEIVDVEDGYLDSRWTELYELRCLVAHTATVTKTHFERITVLVDEISAPLNGAIANLNNVHVPAEEKDQIVDNVPLAASSLPEYNYGSLISPIANIQAMNFNRVIANSVLPLLNNVDLKQVVGRVAAQNAALISQALGPSFYGQTLASISGLIPAMVDLQKYQRALVAAGLQGQRFNPDVDIEIQPKHSNELEDGQGPDEIQIEVILREPDENAADNFEDDEIIEAEQQPIELNPFPLTIPTPSNHSRNISHIVRKPTLEEWDEWAFDIKRTRRYLSVDEIAEENIDNEDGEGDVPEAYNRTYDEWTANERLYDKIILQNAGFKLTEDDDFPLTDFRALNSDTIKKIPFALKSRVVTRLYECYCWKPLIENAVNGEVVVYQKIPEGPNSTIVVHSLRQPNDDESAAFRTGIINGRFSEDDENQEVIDLKLNLGISNELYDQLLLGIENATVNGEPLTDANHDAFLGEINPIYKFRVMEALLDVNSWSFRIDDTILG